MFNKDSMKKIVLYLVATVFIAYGIAFSIFISYNNGSTAHKVSKSTERSSHSSSIDEQKEENINSIDEIVVETSSMKINIISEKRDNVKAHMTGNIVSLTDSQLPVLETSVSGKTLNIRTVTKGTVSLTFFYNVELDVYIPSDYSKDLKLSTSSGGMEVSNLTLNNLSCKLSSGSLKLNNVTSNNFDYSASSGSFKADGLYTKKSSMKSSSGSIRVEDFTGDLKASASSGSIGIAYKEFNNNVDLQASSGSVQLDFPSNSEFRLSADASSGSISCDFPITISGDKKRNHLSGTVKNDKNKVNINTSSGSIRVKES